MSRETSIYCTYKQGGHINSNSVEDKFRVYKKLFSNQCGTADYFRFSIVKHEKID